jgi:hypothetical protein
MDKTEQQKAEEFVEELTSLIKKHSQHGVSIGIILGAFEITKYRLLYEATKNFEKQWKEKGEEAFNE